MHIVVSLVAEDTQPWMSLLQAALPEARVERHEPGQLPRPEAPQADYVIAAYRSETLFAEQRSPKAVFTVSAGVGHVLGMADFPCEVPLIRVEDAGMAPQMIRYVLTAAMRFVQRFDTYRRQQRDAQWVQHRPLAPAQITAGVMGLGVIGAAIARALAAQGFVVRGHARTPKRIAGVDCRAGDEAFAAFVTGVDVLVNVLPSTPSTIGILDRTTLSRLADGAHLVNVGRGNALVEADLLALLDAGKLSGATLDVFRKEPLPPDHPFWQRPEITLTPHVSGLTIPEETVAQVAEKIR
ncbi:MAG: glyoxylate/hydroxypyruvate reductase A, partial [Casimicrobiaceae bacterium]